MVLQYFGNVEFGAVRNANAASRNFAYSSPAVDPDHRILFLERIRIPKHSQLCCHQLSTIITTILVPNSHSHRNHNFHIHPPQWVGVGLLSCIL